MRNLELILPEQTPLLNTWQRMHWRERQRVQERFAWLVRKAIVHKPITPIENCTIIIERSCSGRLPDWDGLYGGLKPVLDCLVVRTKTNPYGLNIIVDDSPKYIRKLIAIPKQCKREDHQTKIIIKEI